MTLDKMTVLLGYFQRVSTVKGQKCNQSSMAINFIAE